MNFYVYILFREDGHPFYVGYGQNDRWSVHEWDARRGRRGLRFNIIRKIQAAGSDVPKIKLHENLTEETAKQYERVLIQAIGRRPHGPLANLTDGGSGVSNPSPTVRAKISAAARNISDETRARMSAGCLGRKHTPETRAKIKAAQVGKKMPLDACAKIGASKLGKPRPPEVRAKLAAAQTGKKASLETRAKMSAAHKERMKSPEVRAKFVGARWRNPQCSPH